MHVAFVGVWAIPGSGDEDLFVDDCAHLLILRSLARDELDEPEESCDVSADDEDGGVGSRLHLLAGPEQRVYCCFSPAFARTGVLVIASATARCFSSLLPPLTGPTSVALRRLERDLSNAMLKPSSLIVSLGLLLLEGGAR